MKRYVVGFLFNNKVGNDQEVVLIKKEKPLWQQGLLNGVGGKIEDGETPSEAMHREFLEEANMDINNWTEFSSLNDENGDWRVHFFYAYSDDITINSNTIEEVQLLKVKDVLNNNYPIIKNLLWLIPMCLYDENYLLIFNYK